ncbi:MAG: uncharacterized protein JWL93_613 [Hyphomicrobiales bacterium]|jgi:uncharacterized membrane protein|nr:uncharacterized protein [Hyphomicrobiales bacterium]
MNDAIDTPTDASSHKTSFGSRIRAWFLTGLVIAGPLAVTIWLVWWFVDTIDNWIKPLVPPTLWPDAYLPFHVPGFGVIIAFIGLTLLGFLAANLAGRTLIALGETILDRMPVVRGLYKSTKQIFETIFSQSGTSFRRVGLVEFPGKGMWTIVFISAPPQGSVATALPSPAEHISVFLPCTPNPTTGFYFFLPASEVIEIPMSPDDAAKLIMSAGLIQPETQSALGQLAEAARRQKALTVDPAA